MRYGTPVSCLGFPVSATWNCAHAKSIFLADKVRQDQQPGRSWASPHQRPPHQCGSSWKPRPPLPTIYEAVLIALLVKNPPAMRETWVRSLGGKIPWRRERLPPPVFWPGEFHGLYSPWGRKESDTTEQLSLSLWERSYLAQRTRSIASPSRWRQPTVQSTGQSRACTRTPGEVIHIVYVSLLFSKDCMWLHRTMSSLWRDKSEWEAVPAKCWKPILHKPPSPAAWPSHPDANPRRLCVL